MKGVQYNKKTDLIINCIISEIDEATNADIGMSINY